MTMKIRGYKATITFAGSDKDGNTAEQDIRIPWQPKSMDRERLPDVVAVEIKKAMAVLGGTTDEATAALADMSTALDKANAEVAALGEKLTRLKAETKAKRAQPKGK